MSDRLRITYIPRFKVVDLNMITRFTKISPTSSFLNLAWDPSIHFLLNLPLLSKQNDDK
jgi:hypothetical protein